MVWYCTRCFAALEGDASGACPSCGGTDVVPAGSPRGQQIAAQTAPPTRFDIQRGHDVCSTCYAVGKPTKSGPSSIAQLLLVAVMLIAFLFFWPVGLLLLVVLLIYSAQRTRRLCGACGAEALVPGDSLRAQELLNGRR